jgi:hypothetical protein
LHGRGLRIENENGTGVLPERRVDVVMKTANCAHCLSPFTIGSQQTKKFCSLGCRRTAGNLKRPSKYNSRGQTRILFICSDCRCAVVTIRSGRRPEPPYCAACRRQKSFPSYRRSWMQKNPDKYIAGKRRVEQRRRTSPKTKVSESVSSQIRQSLKAAKGGRHWESLVGYSLSELAAHLERQFVSGMTWNNYGKWHIDHIVPVSSFEFSSAEDEGFRRCWRLSNIRPLWATDNVYKGAKRIFLL